MSIFSKKLPLLPLLFLLCFACNLENKEQAATGSEITQPETSPSPYDELLEIKKNSDGIIPRISLSEWEAADQRMNAEFQAFFGPQVSLQNSSAAAVEIGPFGKSGRTRALLIDKANQNRYFAGGVSGGLWRSENAGSSWQAIDDFAASLSVTCLAQNSYNTNEIYYGSGEFSSSGNPLTTGNGILKSIDGGLTFQSVASTATSNDFNTVNTLTCSENSQTPNRVFAGTQEGLMISDNGGTSWVKDLAGKRVQDVVSFSNGAVLVSTPNEIYYSLNGAAGTYTIVYQPVLPLTLNRIRIANCASVENVVYAIGVKSNMEVMLKSLDHGQTWNTVTTPIGTAQGGFCLMIGVHPTDPDRVLVGGVAAQYSTDGGSNWSPTHWTHADFHVYGTSTSNPDAFLVGNDGGVYGFDWNTLGTTAQDLNNGYNVTQFYYGSALSSGLKAIGGTQDNGTYFMDAQATAPYLINGGDGSSSYASKSPPGIAFSSQNGHLMRNADISQSLPILCSSTDAQADCFLTRIWNTNTIYFEVNQANEDQLFIVHDNAIWKYDWTGISPNGYTKQAIANSAGYVLDIACEVNPDPIVYFGSGNNILKRIDNASSTAGNQEVDILVNRPSQLINRTFRDIDIDPNDPSRIFLGYTSNGNYSKIWSVTNATTADPISSPCIWTDLSGNLPTDLPVNCLALHPQAPGLVIYAGTDYGLYYTLDGGTHWVKESTVPNVPIFDLDVRQSDNMLFIFTHGRGAYALQLDPVSPISISGNIHTESGSNIAQVLVEAGNSTQTTSTNGNYSLSGLIGGSNYEVVPSKNINYRNGISVLDMVKISRHLTGLEVFTSPYSFVAADVDNNNSISTMDLVEIQRLLLYITNEFPNSPSWKFIPADFVFPNIPTPIANGYPSSISFIGLQQSQSNQDFIGVKIGDVSGNSDPSLRLAPGDPVTLQIEEAAVPAGEVVEIPVRLSDFQNKVGLQLALVLNSNALEIIDARVVAKNGFDDALISVDQNEVHCLWHSIASSGVSATDGSSLLLLKLKAKKDIFSWKNQIELHHEEAENVVFNSQHQRAQIKLRITGAEQTAIALEPYPNPVIDRFLIPINSTTATKIKLELFDLQGKLVRQQSYSTGEGTATLQLTDLEALNSGIYLYVLKTTDGQLLKEGKLIKE